MQVIMQKVHGSENDFFLIDEMRLERPLMKEEINELCRSLCDRKTGLLGGADGLLLVQKATGNGEALAKMRVINSDGSEASMCGNGLRTVARYIAEKTNRTTFVIETKFATLNVKQAPNIAGNIKTYQVEISPVSFDTKKIPMRTNNLEIVNEMIPELSDQLTFSVVAVPNPHLITFVNHNALYSSEFERIATFVNSENPLFPEGINVSFVEVLEKDKLFVRTYERGVGFTNACGTAMCASSLMHVLLNEGNFCEPILVRNPGGLVKTVVYEDPKKGYWMELIGNATVTYRLSGEIMDLIHSDFENIECEKTTEQEDYLSFINR